jgi:hypothetical protein
VLLAKPTAAAADKQWAAVALPASGKSLAVLDPATGVFNELSLDPSLAAVAVVTPLAGGALLHISSSSSSSSSSGSSAVVALAAGSSSSLELSTLVKCSSSSNSDCAVGGAAGVFVPALPDDFTDADAAAVGASASGRVFAVRAARDSTDSSTVTVAVHEVVAGRRSSSASEELQYETELAVEERGALRAVFPLVCISLYFLLFFNVYVCMHIL